MPDGTPAQASPGQPQQPQQAPFGQSQTTSPSPNRGHEAAGLQALGLVVQKLSELLPMLGAGSDPGKAVHDAIGKLAKFVPAGSVTPGSQRNQLEQMAMRQGQQNSQMQALQKMRQQGQAGQGQPGQAAAA